MIQIINTPGIQYGNETRQQGEERDRKIAEANRLLKERWEDEQRQRAAPMKAMREWAEKRGINRGGKQ